MRVKRDIRVVRVFVAGIIRDPAAVRFTVPVDERAVNGFFFIFCSAAGGIICNHILFLGDLFTECQIRSFDLDLIFGSFVSSVGVKAHGKLAGFFDPARICRDISGYFEIFRYLFSAVFGSIPPVKEIPHTGRFLKLSRDRIFPLRIKGNVRVVRILIAGIILSSGTVRFAVPIPKDAVDGLAVVFRAAAGRII